MVSGLSDSLPVHNRRGGADTVWPLGFLPLGVLLAVNVAIRYATDPHVRTIAVTFRQCAPLIATAGELQFLGGTEIDPIVGCLRSEQPVLRRLKLISRWTNGNPFMLSTGSGSLALALNDIVGAVYEYLNLALLLDGHPTRPPSG